MDYPYLSISTTIFHGNTDFRKILAQFREKREKGMKISFFPHLVHHTSPANAAYALTKEDYASVLRQWKELVLELVEGFKETGNINWELTALFYGLFRRLEATYQYGETYCFSRNLYKVGPTGKPCSCLYIRDVPLSWTNWQEQQAALLDYLSPNARGARCTGCAEVAVTRAWTMSRNVNSTMPCIPGSRSWPTKSRQSGGWAMLYSKDSVFVVFPDCIQSSQKEELWVDLVGSRLEIVHNGNPMTIDLDALAPCSSTQVVTGRAGDMVLYNYRELLMIYGLKPLEFLQVFRLHGWVQVDKTHRGVFVKIFCPQEQQDPRSSRTDWSRVQHVGPGELHPVDRKTPGPLPWKITRLPAGCCTSPGRCGNPHCGRMKSCISTMGARQSPCRKGRTASTCSMCLGKMLIWGRSTAGILAGVSS